MAHIHIKSSSDDAQALSCCNVSAAPKPSFGEKFSETLTTYQPLIAIFLASLAGAFFAGIAHGGDHTFDVGMRVGMGLFLVPLALLKLFDLGGFARGFALYDPLARRVPWYGYAYPFLELGVGLLLVAGLWVNAALILSIPLLGITAVGIALALARGVDLNCACVGAKFGLPLGKISLIENVAMVLMAALMLSI